MFIMNKVSTDRRAAVIGALVEGNSIRATCRMTGTAKGTVARLLATVGDACARYQNDVLKELVCRRLQVDEIWSFCYAKEKNVPGNRRGQFGYGDVWTWTALDSDSKLVPVWLVGGRDAGDAYEFLSDLRTRLTNRVQLTTDGHRAYLSAVEDTFGADIDYAMLIKLYGTPQEPEKRYSPAQCIGVDTRVVQGNPDPAHISTSYVERHNLTMRMSMRRFTRLTNTFSKKMANHEAAIALHFMWYNFGRVHGTIKTTPANAAGVDSHRWTLREIAELAESN